MTNNPHNKSLKTLEENQRWLDEHADQTVHAGDLPISQPQLAKDASPAGDSDQEQ